jgi:GNAT superfamily N-acetyltransferase
MSPDFRFLGVSKALLARMEARALELGLAEVWLNATRLASRMYASSGYYVVAQIESTFGTLPGLHMRKLL